MNRPKKKLKFESRTHLISPSEDNDGYIFTNKKNRRWFFLGANERYMKDTFKVRA